MSDWTKYRDEYANIVEGMVDAEIEAFAEAIVDSGPSLAFRQIIAKLTVEQLLGLQELGNRRLKEANKKFRELGDLASAALKGLIATSLMSMKEQVKEI